ncbi:unnamed protein product, partial [Staurois parvus]
MYTDHQGTDDQCALMISVAPAVPPVSANQCQLSLLISATYSVPISASSMPHISAYQCTSMPHISAPYQCQSVLPISASQCNLLVRISVAYQCSSVLPISA